MEGGREESCTGASSCNTESDESSIDCDLYYRKSGKSASRTSSFSLLQSRFSFLSCIIVFLALEGGGIRNQGVGFAAGAGITLPVSRSFSKLEGSGTADGESGGMTAEHYQQLREHDRKRAFLHHGRSLVSTTIADFPLSGNDYSIGLYYTEIGLGTPSYKYFVQVDTGSDLLWVNCKPCPDCPTSSDLQSVELRLYDPGSSSTSSNTSCSSSACSASVDIGGGLCVDNSCYYGFGYGDGSTAMGYLVEDTMTYNTGATQTSSTVSATVALGCGFNQTGASLTSSSQATDGIMGFGRASLSVVSQLVNAGLTTSMFAHCLQGDTGDGGIFVIGDVQEPGIVYTDLVPLQSHYNVVLQSMTLGGTTLNVPPSVFDNPGLNSGTIFDSGTTLALLVDDAYHAFVQQLLSIATPVTYIFQSPCFPYQSDPSSTFPNLILNFAGINGAGASMELVPTNYLYKQSSGSNDYWCLGWTKSSDSGLGSLTILGDIVLKNKLVIYDLGNSRIGWVNHNCQSSINVISGSGQEVNLGAGGSSASRTHISYHWTAVLIYSVLLIYGTASL